METNGSGGGVAKGEGGQQRMKSQVVVRKPFFVQVARGYGRRSSENVCSMWRLYEVNRGTSPESESEAQKLCGGHAEVSAG